jgi:hypothetical protein
VAIDVWGSCNVEGEIDMTKSVRRSAKAQEVVPPPATHGPAGDPVLKGVSAALRALYAPVAEHALPIYYGPVLGRLFLKGRR